jgi:hypothetical protein
MLRNVRAPQTLESIVEHYIRDPDFVDLMMALRTKIFDLYQKVRAPAPRVTSLSLVDLSASVAGLHMGWRPPPPLPRHLLPSRMSAANPLALCMPHRPGRPDAQACPGGR